MNGDATESSDDSVGHFAEEARLAGLTLPVRRRTSLWQVAGICATILLVSVGIGVATGWMNLRPSNDLPPGLFGPQSCAGQAGQRVELEGATLADSDPLLTESLVDLTDQFFNAYGNCVEVSYSGSSLESGLAAMDSRMADFAVLESPPTLTQLNQIPYPVLVLPFGLASVTIGYNLPSLHGTLDLNGSVLAAIYSGTITTWNSPAIEALNPSVNLPAGLPISVLYRSDASPLNVAFSTYLADSSSAWNATVGSGSSVAFPIGTPVTSGTSMVERLTNVTGAIGYLATGTPLLADLGTATLQNPSGNLTSPSVPSVVSAAAGDANGTKSAGANWTGLSLLNAAGAASYPLSYLSYLVVYQDLGRTFAGTLNLLSAQWETTFLWWVVTDGGYLTAPLGFDQLPPGVVAMSQTVLEKVAFDGKSILETAEGSETGGETGEF